MRIHRFTIISGIGWIIDMTVMASLVGFGAWVFLANLVGATLALTFVFFVAQNRVFVSDGGFAYRKFAAYSLFQMMAVPLASLAIHGLTDSLLSLGLNNWSLLATLVPAEQLRLVIISVFAKGIVTPLTLYSNFVFMGWLLERRVSYW